jgi:hypothetical protein
MSQVYIVTRYFAEDSTTNISDIIVGVFTTIEKAINAMIADMEHTRVEIYDEDEDDEHHTPSYEEVLGDTTPNAHDEIYTTQIYGNHFSIYCKLLL